MFVRNAFGEVVQADARSFLHAGDDRTEMEIKSFMRRWVVDAFSWTPLDVADRTRAALRVVDPEGTRRGEGGHAARGTPDARREGDLRPGPRRSPDPRRRRRRSS